MDIGTAEGCLPVIVSGATAAVAGLQFGNVHMTLLVSGVALAITSTRRALTGRADDRAAS